MEVELIDMGMEVGMRVEPALGESGEGLRGAVEDRGGEGRGRSRSEEGK